MASSPAWPTCWSAPRPTSTAWAAASSTLPVIARARTGPTSWRRSSASAAPARPRRRSATACTRCRHLFAIGVTDQIPSHYRKDARARAKALNRDVHSLTDHAGFLSQKINFTLDATLGLINIEQNAIIKIFSVVAVVFLPPTLIASIYGMNFEIMPELSWQFGYPFAVVLMVISAVMPYLYFKRRGWL